MLQRNPRHHARRCLLLKALEDRGPDGHAPVPTCNRRLKIEAPQHLERGGPDGPSGLGVAIGLTAGATFGAGTVLSKKLRFRSPVLLITTWQLLLGTPPAFVVWLLLHDHTYLNPDAGRGLKDPLIFSASISVC